MEGKLTILVLFVILDYVYTEPRVSIPSKTAFTKSDRLKKSTTERIHLNQGHDIHQHKNLSARDGAPLSLEEDDDEPNHEPENAKASGRPLSVGDTFTPAELLPITRKLIDKKK
ncbi:uncharacterized protein LOC135088154 [Ostrinia nubilalis]|uniref:uncharacterized protein LOC135088154 n=1 Tax=Ostrinia nubilalis TaxID=29057 RepID=UPI0030823DA6